MAASSNRAAILTKLHKVLNKHYKPVLPAERPVLEQLLYACCLEDAPPDAADEAFARLQESFFDWNEVRVTTVRELSEIMKRLPDPERSAINLKQTLHSVFESIYEFQLDVLKKQNLGAAVKEIEKYRGTTSFTVAYVVQSALGGHSIPVSATGMDLMYIVGAVSETEVKKGAVPGLERAIPKTKGVEFGSLFNQLAADFVASPFSPTVRGILIDISPDAKDRLPKRGVRKDAKSKSDQTGKTTKANSKKSAKTKSSSSSDAKKSAANKGGKKKAAPKATKKSAGSKQTKSGKKISQKATKGTKKSASKQLARRKPR